MSSITTISSPASDPKPLVRDVLLRDGSTMRLQAPTPPDQADIKAFYDGLSTESRYFRFHGFGTHRYCRARTQKQAALIAWP